MIVRIIPELYGNSNNKVIANKKRISSIKGNISNKSRLKELFNKLEEYLTTGNIGDTLNLLVNEMFFEEIANSFVEELHIAYVVATDKNDFINKLRESYIIRGVRSIKPAWSPVMGNKTVTTNLNKTIQISIEV
ncbi:MAG: hypothetical protein ACRCX8_02585 [Sarcina sp.]